LVGFIIDRSGHCYLQILVGNINNRIFFFVVARLIGLALLLSACGSPSKVAVEERRTVNARVETEKIGGSLIRIVQPGDTLYSIAFAAGIDITQLAAWNRLSDTSKLQPGQRIRLTRPLHVVATKPASAKPVKVKPGIAGSGATTGSVARPNVPKKVPGAANQVAEVVWQWPTAGRVTAAFSTRNGQQGIDIQGKLGQSVLAASSREVVYVGNGLKGYGNLVIIKHNERYLSAYANNLETFVREGQRVAGRHVIASVGYSKRRQPALHFQIRKDGKPVNPVAYLPKI